MNIDEQKDEVIFFRIKSEKKKDWKKSVPINKFP
jgi:hypothetical protein